MPSSLSSLTARIHHHVQTTCHFSAVSAPSGEETELRDDETKEQEEEDTIYALSSGSATQPSALAVIRLSGPRAGESLQALSAGRNLPRPRVATLRRLTLPNSSSDERLLDDALILFFPGPNSYTGEDVVEIHCHGSRAVVEGILAALGSLQNLRYAERGEFTQRAFGNNKLSLSQTEALGDLLTAVTARQRGQALRVVNEDDRVFQSWRQRLTAGLAHAEAVIDFGDDEMSSVEEDDFDDDVPQDQVWGNVVTDMRLLRQQMSRVLASRKHERIRDGLVVCLLGPPNAGKSSLFNNLSRDEHAAIVSPTAGTTRDVLQVSLDLGGLHCRLSDTAGMRGESTDDDIEKEGMDRAWRVARSADMVLVVVDGSQDDWEDEWRRIVNGLAVEDNPDDPASKTKTNEKSCSTMPKILLLRNKLDLMNPDSNATPNHDSHSSSSDDLFAEMFDVSCKTKEGMDALIQGLTRHVQQLVDHGSSTPNDSDGCNENILVTRVRHRQHLQASADALKRFEEASRHGLMAVDLAAEELRLATSELGRITGAVDVEDVLDKLFTDFCIGK